MTREEARAAIAAMPAYGIGSDALWRSRGLENQVEAMIARMPARLDGIAKLMIGITSGSEEERMSAMWFLRDALQAEARALRLAEVALRDDMHGFIRRQPTPKRAKPKGKKGR